MSEEVFELARERWGATFSECRTWRYELWRWWGGAWQRGESRALIVIGLNPSTADESNNDPTIRRCLDFARRLDCAGLWMLNLYAFRATDPADMVRADEPQGPDNLDTIRSVCASYVGPVVVAWGALRLSWRPRVAWQSTIADTLAAVGRPVHCWGTTSDGSPRHPLYLKKDCALRPWEA